MEKLNPYLVLGIGVVVGIILYYFYDKNKKPVINPGVNPPPRPNHSPVVDVDTTRVTETVVSNEQLQNMARGGASATAPINTSMKVGGISNR